MHHAPYPILALYRLLFTSQIIMKHKKRPELLGCDPGHLIYKKILQKMFGIDNLNVVQYYILG